MNFFYLYTLIIPLLITGLCLFFFKPFNFKNIVKGLTTNIIPLIIYVFILYFLETEEYIRAYWSFYTVLFFFIFYLVIIIVLNIIKKRLE